MICDKKFKLRIYKSDGKYMWEASYKTKLTDLGLGSTASFRTYEKAKQNWNATVRRLGLSQRNIVK